MTTSLERTMRRAFAGALKDAQEPDIPLPDVLQQTIGDLSASRQRRVATAFGQAVAYAMRGALDGTRLDALMDYRRELVALDADEPDDHQLTVAALGTAARQIAPWLIEHTGGGTNVDEANLDAYLAGQFAEIILTFDRDDFDAWVEHERSRQRRERATLVCDQG